MATQNRYDCKRSTSMSVVFLLGKSLYFGVGKRKKNRELMGKNVIIECG